MGTIVLIVFSVFVVIGMIAAEVFLCREPKKKQSEDEQKKDGV